MKQPLRSEMPIVLSLPLRFAKRPRTRRRRARRMMFWLVLAIAVALLASI